MFRSAELPPALVAEEVHALVFRRVDVAGPEKPDVLVVEDVLRRLAAKSNIDVVRSDQLEARPAFELVVRRRRLVQLRFAVRQFLERHRRLTWFEEDLGVVAIAQVLVAVEHVFQVEARHGGEEYVRRLVPMNQFVNPVVAGSMLAVGLVVSDDGGEIAHPERVVSHGDPPDFSRTWTRSSPPRT